MISFMITMGFVLFAERNTLKIGGFSGEKQAFAIKNEAGELKMQFLGEEYTLYKK